MPTKTFSEKCRSKTGGGAAPQKPPPPGLARLEERIGMNFK
jgi:hypothetical protein